MTKDIIITIPKSISWSDYKKELKQAEQGDILNFKVSSRPNTDIGNKCYICYDGKIVGYHIICGIEEKEFDCTTTGKHWKGLFVQRTGQFYKLKNTIPMKGFQGYRYFENKISENNKKKRCLHEDEDGYKFCFCKQQLYPDCEGYNCTHYKPIS